MYLMQSQQVVEERNKKLLFTIFKLSNNLIIITLTRNY